MSRLLELYKNQIQKDLQSKLKMSNIFKVPKIQKIILNMGIGEAKDDSKLIDRAIEDLSLISGQKAVKTNAKKAISGFKIRAGMPLGAKVTLRNKIMYEFLDRLVNIALPRVKDFRGLSSKGIDSSNNFSFGIKEHIVFPEVNFDKVDKIRGLDITIVISSNNREGALELLKEFNFPINQNKNWGYFYGKNKRNTEEFKKNKNG